jgi:hypothetical protein
MMVLFASCNSSKKTVQETNGNTMTSEQSNDKAMDAQMLNDGFHIGKIKELKNSKCDYIIIDETTHVQLDPINFSEDDYKAYKKDAQKIYFKYRPLRMMNRCTDANPIQLTSIKKREGT